MQRKIRGWFLFMIICMIVITYIPSVKIFSAEAEKEQENANTEDSEDAENSEEEEAKTAISQTKITIPINEAKPEKLSVLNPKEGVVYTFASGNKKIVTIGKKTGVLTGKKAGTTNVSLLKKGKKKNTIVGVCTVTVAKAKIIKKNQKMTASVNGIIKPAISYKNAKAKYIYKSGNKKVVKVGEKIDDTGATSIAVTALSEGKTTLTIKEKYKKKTTVIGKIAITVKKPSLATQDIYMIKGQTIKIPNVITINYQDTSREVVYDYESSDISILSVNGERMTAEKVSSSVSLHVYQTIDGERSKLGTVMVVISEASNRTPEALGDSNYIDLSDYNNDYEEGYDDYEDNDYYPVGSDYVEDETTDSDDSYDDYENYLEEMEHTWE